MGEASPRKLTKPVEVITREATIKKAIGSGMQSKRSGRLSLAKYAFDPWLPDGLLFPMVAVPAYD